MPAVLHRKSIFIPSLSSPQKTNLERTYALILTVANRPRTLLLLVAQNEFLSECKILLNVLLQKSELMYEVAICGETPSENVKFLCFCICR